LDISFKCKFVTHIADNCDESNEREVSFSWVDEGSFIFKAGDKYHPLTGMYNEKMQPLNKEQAILLSCKGAQNEFARENVIQGLKKKVPCDHTVHGSTTGTVVIVFGCLGLATALAWIVWFIVHRKSAIVKASQFHFMVLFCLGAGLANIGTMVNLGENTNFSCMSRPWVFHLSFSITLGPLFVKAQRVHQIFANKKLRKVVRKLSNSLGQFVAILIIDIVILLLWTFVSPEKAVVETKDVGSIRGIAFTVCRPSETVPLVYLAVLYKAMLLIYGCYISYLTRNVHRNFAESKYIMLAMYNITVFGAISVLLIYGIGLEVEASVVLQSASIFLSAVAALSVVNIPILTRVNTVTEANLFDTETTVHVGSHKTNSTNDSINTDYIKTSTGKNTQKPKFIKPQQMDPVVPGPSPFGDEEGLDVEHLTS